MRYLKTRFGPVIPELIPAKETFGVIDPMHEDHLAPGVSGYMVETDDGLYVPVINAEQEGSGDVGRFIASLPTDQRVVFPCVISARLAGMLVRRGFRVAEEWSEDAQEFVEVYVRPARVSAPEAGADRR